MKKILSRSGAFLCAAVLLVPCCPELGNNVSLAEILQMQNSIEKTGSGGIGIIDMSATEAEIKSDTKADDADYAFTATAYALHGVTRIGNQVRRGIIAADPRVLPLGTKVRIAAGEWSGIYLVADTGRVIKGRLIDVWVPDNSEARKFGRRKVIVNVLGK